MSEPALSEAASRHDRLSLFKRPRPIVLVAVLTGTVATLVHPLPVSGQRAFAPRFGLDRWTTEDGLPSETISEVVQSADGYLWLIASGSVVRFDGTRFVTFPVGGASGAGLPGGRPVALMAAGGDTVWAVLQVLDRTHLIRMASGRSELVVSFPEPWNDLLRGADGTLWLARSATMRRLDGDRLGEAIDAGVSRSYVEGTELGPQWALDRSGELWIRDAYRDSVGIVSRSGIRFVEAMSFHVLLSRPSTRDVLVASVRGDTVVVRDLDGGRIAAFRNLPDAIPRVVDRQGRLWITTDEGFEVYEPGSLDPVATVEMPPDSRVTGVIEDREGNLWARTFTAGLFRIRELPAHVVGLEEGLLTSQVMMVSRARNGTVIATDRNGRVYRIEDGRAHILHEPDSTVVGGYGLNSVLTAGEDRTGTVWLVSHDPRRESLYALIGKRDTLPDIMLPIEDHVRVIVEDPRPGGGLWFGSPTVYRGQAIGATMALTDTFRIATEPIRDLVIDPSGAVWIPTDSALVRITDEGMQQFRGEPYPYRIARSILADDDGTLWIGTYGAGLLRFRDDVFRSVTEADGLAENVVSGLVDDGAGNIWMAGNRSIHRVSRADLASFLDGAADRVEGVAYTRRDGIRNPETSGWQSARDDAGRLWFATFDGLVVIDPYRAIALQRDTPVVHIEELRLANGEARTRQPATGGGEAGVRLAAGERRFDVAWTAISMRDPSGVRFRYKLDGFDEEWQDADNRHTATYTNVGAGRYTFRVHAVSGGGVPAREAALALVVEPFFYETKTFFALLALALIGTGVLIVRSRERTLVARQAELNRLVDERTAALTEQTRKAEEATRTVAAQAERLQSIDRARSRFFANVSHEFRTPLTLIEGPLRDLRRGRLGPLPDAAKEEIDVVLESGRRLNALVEQLLDIARLEVGELKLEPRAADAVAFLRRIVRAFEPLARAREITFDAALPDHTVDLVFDADRLEKVMTNLLGNAFKFTDRNGHVRLEGSADRTGDRPGFTIRIADDGIGIPEAALDRVFDRFYQVDDSPSRQHQGTGVGLALARDLIELHGGSITVSSEIGKGTTFSVWLPLADASPLRARVDDRRAPDDEIPGDMPGTSPAVHDTHDADTGTDVTTVLLVEDNARVRAYMRRHLQEHYHVIEAADGRAGLEEARRVVPDLIISDVMMPEMDGQTMVEEIRNDPDIDFLPVILLTARASHESVLQGLRGGADDYLTKPFDVEELLLRAHNVISGRRKLRDRFLGDRRPMPSLPPPPSARSDEGAAFAARVHEILTGSIDDEDFGVDDLAKALHMSRSSLYRRTEENFGRSPMDLIMGFRLDQAARWLRETDARVNEIAYGVGFKSVPHFSRKFREHFGATPTAYRRG